MLEQYIKRFALESLQIKPEYLDKIKSDEGIYAIDISDKLICTLEEQDNEDAVRFALMVALGKEEQPQQFLDRMSFWYSRLRQTPWQGVCKLLVAPEDLTAGLYVEFDPEKNSLDQEQFNRWLLSFMLSAAYVSGDEQDEEQPAEYKVESELPALEDEDLSACYQQLLESVGLDEEQLLAQFNRLEVNENFGTQLEYNAAANCLLLINSLEVRVPAQQVVNLLGQNSGLPPNVSFNYDEGAFYLQQTLELRSTDEEGFRRALSRQEEMLEELKAVLGSDSNEEDEEEEEEEQHDFTDPLALLI